MQNLILTVGLQASGKSTWAKDEVRRSKGTIKRVNKDDLRALIDSGEFSQNNEKFILKTRDSIVLQALRAGNSVIVDDTNFEEKHFETMRYIAKCSGKDVHVFEKLFPIDVATAVIRDKGRPNPVGEKVIKQYYKKYCYPAPRKMNDAYIYKGNLELPTAYNPVSQPAIICDLDGTLANIDHRSPYDSGLCEKDGLNEHVADAVLGFYKKGYKVLFVSGREERFREQTVRWLDKHMLFDRMHAVADTKALGYTDAEIATGLSPIFYALYMRQTGDFRKDYIIKKEIFYKEIWPNYNVQAVFDDRPSVVRMWRYEIGFRDKVFQVNDLEF